MDENNNQPIVNEETNPEEKKMNPEMPAEETAAPEEKAPEAEAQM